MQWANVDWVSVAWTVQCCEFTRPTIRCHIRPFRLVSWPTEAYRWAGHDGVLCVIMTSRVSVHRTTLRCWRQRRAVYGLQHVYGLVYTYTRHNMSQKFKFHPRTRKRIIIRRKTTTTFVATGDPSGNNKARYYSVVTQRIRNTAFVI